MPSIRYLSLPDAVALHSAIMRRTGAAPAPLRDEAGLASVLMRPQAAAEYVEADLIRQAAVLASGIARVEAFRDGNKRTAFAVCETFLRINGLMYPGPGEDFARQLERVSARETPLAEATDAFEAWLRERVVPR